MIIRPAVEPDLPDILAIYNDAVVNTTAIWNWNTADLANRQAWFESRAKQGYPILVAGAEGSVLGYASYGDWRPFDGYRFTVEHSIYVADAARGQGVGAKLLGALIGKAQDAGKHVMLGGIEAGNEASLALHRRFGFVETGRLPQVGQKFGKWLDLVFMQLKLGD
jgi:L-amino acid N-acyltransferase YncA